MGSCKNLKEGGGARMEIICLAGGPEERNMVHSSWPSLT